MKIYFFSALKRGCASLLLGASLMGLAGISNVKANESGADINYDFLDGNGDYKLLIENNDVYIEKIDGTDKRQITHTPEIIEHNAVFSKDGNYIVFIERYDNPRGGDPIFKYFVTKRESDDSTKKEVSISEAFWITSGIK